MKPYKPLKGILLTALCWLAVWAAGFLTSLLMYAGMFPTFETAKAERLTGDGRLIKITCEVVRIHPLCFAAGAALGLLLFALIRFLLLSRTYPFRQTEKRLPLRVWRMQGMIGLLGLLFSQTAGKVIMKEHAPTLRSSLPIPRTIRPAFAEYAPFILTAAAAVLLLRGCQAIRQNTPEQIAQSRRDHTDLYIMKRR